MGIERKILVATVGEIAEGRTKNFRYGPHAAIAYNDHGVVKAYVNRCTHMGGPVELANGAANTASAPVFRCRWHQAEFSPGTGDAIEGEAPQGTRLTPIELTEENGALYAIFRASEDEFGF